MQRPPDDLPDLPHPRPLRANKTDQQKARYELIPADALHEVVNVLTTGAVKYNDWNWEGGFKWSRLIGAILRHRSALTPRSLRWRGSRTDKDHTHPSAWADIQGYARLVETTGSSNPE